MIFFRFWTLFVAPQTLFSNKKLSKCNRVQMLRKKSPPAPCYNVLDFSRNVVARTIDKLQVVPCLTILTLPPKLTKRPANLFSLLYSLLSFSYSLLSNLIKGIFGFIEGPWSVFSLQDATLEVQLAMNAQFHTTRWTNRHVWKRDGHEFVQKCPLNLSRVHLAVFKGDFSRTSLLSGRVRNLLSL